MTKRSRFEAAGAAPCWVLDPVELSLTAWDRGGGRHVEVADVHGEEESAATLPFPVRVTPARLGD